MDWKDSVRVAVSSSIDLTSSVSVLDGVTVVEGDRVLLMAQSEGN